MKQIQINKEEEEFFSCHSCEKEVEKENFNEDIGLCDNCVDYGDFAYEMMKDLELEREYEEKN